jgi:hypothetical protein
MPPFKSASRALTLRISKALTTPGIDGQRQRRERKDRQHAAEDPTIS